MKTLISLAAGAMIVFGTGCLFQNNLDIEPPRQKILKNVHSSEKDTILGDDYGIYRDAFPDTSFYKNKGNMLIYYKDSKGNLSALSASRFGFEQDTISNLIVFYRLKWSDFFSKIGIDSAKAPPVIIRLEGNGIWNHYLYDREFKKYIRVEEKIPLDKPFFGDSPEIRKI